ncbi:hypothetical protein [Cytobacillus oceanisediminis]|uniref:hypothetical protein n=1 Tax=Cytobacillus oceanisediminis TaxID=665099 RepID=UPI001FB3F15A|nr:hypothetical protein [Cytobacillus oceanisediminis]UOE58194.1 hypothetical protein IRB79_27210 [Cytobacillus oceanisediminis]
MFDPRKTERAFIRKVKKSEGLFKTATGKDNRIVDIDKDAYSILTAKSAGGNKIKRTMVRRAIQYVYHVKTVTRKDLEKFSRFSSALLGLLRTMLRESVKYVKTPSGLYRLTLKGVRFFFAGCSKAKTDMEMVAKYGGRYILISYYYVKNGIMWRKHAERLGLKVLLDSGAYTLWEARKKGRKVKDLDIREYAAFIKKHEDILLGYFNLDVVGDSEKSKEHENFLKSQGLKPIPVYHVGSPLAELHSIVKEDHPVIGIGGSVRKGEGKRLRYFEEIFNAFPLQNFHFLGGSSNLVTAFPWFSADSTAWIGTRSYGRIIDEKGQRYAPQIDEKERMQITVSYLSGLERITA